MLNTRVCRRKNKTSQFRGVSKSTTSSINPWKAVGTRDKKPFHVGMFKTELDAAIAWDKWALMERGEFASLNFPERKEMYLAGFDPS